MQSRKILSILLVAAILMPVLVMLLLGVGRLLTAMQDIDGSILLDRAALLLGLLWVIDLVAIVLLLALDHLVRSHPSNREEPHDD